MEFVKLYDYGIYKAMEYEHIFIWVVPEMKVPPNHLLIDGFSIITHPAFGVPP